MVYQSFLSNGSPSIGSSEKEFTFVLFSFWGTHNRIIKVYLLHKILFLVDPVPHRSWKIVLFNFSLRSDARYIFPSCRVFVALSHKGDHFGWKDNRSRVNGITYCLNWYSKQTLAGVNFAFEIMEQFFSPRNERRVLILSFLFHKTLGFFFFSQVTRRINLKG